jgi:hypothetical protein
MGLLLKSQHVLLSMVNSDVMLCRQHLHGGSRNQSQAWLYVLLVSQKPMYAVQTGDASGEATNAQVQGVALHGQVRKVHLIASPVHSVRFASEQVCHGRYILIIPEQSHVKRFCFCAPQ